MICRHGPNDPSCSSNSSYREYYSDPVVTPDASKYSIEAVEAVGEHLVLKVLYPNCAKCSYEGNKILVFLNTSIKEALLWKKIDPHFSDPKRIKTVKEAPPPAARFPANNSGWTDAVVFAKSKCK